MIKHLEILNFKTIQNFEMDFDGSVYFITGDNEKGKSTLMQAIFTMLTGDRSDNLLTKGKEKGHVYAEIKQGDEVYNVTLSFSEKTPRGKIKIERQNDDLFVTTKKSALETIFGYNDFDAAEFVGWSETAAGRKKQVELIMSLLPVQVQNRIQEIDSDVAIKMEERRNTGKEMDTQVAIVNNYNVDESFVATYEKPVDIEQLKVEKTKADEHNTKIAEVNKTVTERQAKLDEWPAYENEQLKPYQSAIEVAEQNVKDLEERLNYAKQQVKEKNVEFDNKKSTLDDLYKRTSADIKKQADWLQNNKPIKVDELNVKYENAVQHNENYKKVVEYNEKVSKLDEVTAKHKEQTTEIEKLRAERVELIAKNPLPVEGLTFDNDQLFLNGIPFAENEVSTSQTMDVAVKLMMAKNPKCKMFRISRGESLGGNKMKAIIDYAKTNGFQGFIEKVVPFQDDLIVEEYVEKDVQ